MDLNRNQQLAAIILIGLALIGLGVAAAKPSLKPGSGSFTISEPGEKKSAPDATAKDVSAGSASVPETSILVHVAGRVKFPNVYSLSPGSRVIDAVKAAGGPQPDAYLDAVNLAAKVKDGEQIFIPSRNMKSPMLPVVTGGRPQAPSAVPAVGSASVSTGKLKTPGSGYVSINSADSTELQRLPGVGPSTAQKIIDYRSQIGRFSSVDQLVDVKGIGPKTLEKMRPFITL